MFRALVATIILLLPSISYAQILKCYGEGVNNVTYTMTSNMTPLFSNIQCAPIRYEEGMSNRFLEGVTCVTEYSISFYYPNDDSWLCEKQNAQYNQWRCRGIGRYNTRNYLKLRCMWENDREIPE